MKITARTCKSRGINSYEEIMAYFSRQFLNSEDPYDAEEFIELFSEHIDDSDFPCDAVNLNSFISNNRFAITLSYHDEKIAYIQFQVKANRIIKVYSTHYDKKDFAIFQPIIDDYFKQRNAQIYNEWLKRCNIKAINEIEIENYRDYKLESTTTMRGTLEEIFDKFTSINDMYKYCNGTYIKFKNDDIKQLYNNFIDMYDGNYFLDNAVKRGCIID